jgi:integrase
MSVIKRTYPSGKVAWRVQVWRDRQRIFDATFSTRREAVAVEQDLSSRSRRPGYVTPESSRVVLSLVAAEWLLTRRSKAPRTQDSDESTYRRLVAPSFGNHQLSDIDPTVISGWLAALAQRGIAPSSRRRALWVLRAILGHAVDSRRLEHNPAVKVKVGPAGRRRTGQSLSAQELAALIDALPNNCQPFATVLGLAGLRFSEASALLVADVRETPYGLVMMITKARTHHNGGGAASTGPTKSTLSRAVPVPLDLVEWVQNRRVEANADAPLFPTTESGSTFWSPSNWRRCTSWTKTVANLGHSGLRPHDLRHTAATLMLSAGAPLTAVSAVLGHSSPQVTAEIYSHVLDGQTHQAIAFLPPLQRTLRATPAHLPRTSSLQKEGRIGERPCTDWSLGGDSNS